MRCISTGHDLFYPMAIESMTENEFSKKLVRLLKPLFSTMHVLYFKHCVYSESNGGSVPDLALVDRQYRFWIIVEVETTSHSLFGHVLPQVKRLQFADYSICCAEYLAKQGLDLKSSARMIANESPRIAVILNEENHEWRIRLAKEGVSMLVASVFRSSSLAECLEIDGTLPLMPDHIVAYADPEFSVPNARRLRSFSSSFEQLKGTTVSIWWGENRANWRCLEADGFLWLLCDETSLLDPLASYAIMSDHYDNWTFTRS